MNRRKFLATGSAAGLLAVKSSTVPAAAKEPAKTARPSGPVKMKLGDQTKPTNDAHLAYLARYSVRNICG